MPNWMRILSLSFVALCVVPSASAHDNSLKQMRPADGSTVRAPIEQVVLTYAQRPSISEVTITAPGGTKSTVDAKVAGVQATIPFQPDEPGEWTLRWRILQGDGHGIGYTRTLNVAETAIESTNDTGDRAGFFAALLRWIGSLFS